MNDELVVSNDNGHGPETVMGTVEFPKVGYYPVDIRYFNGGATFLGEGFDDVVATVDGVEPFYTPPEGPGSGRTPVLTAIVVTPEKISVQIPNGVVYDIEYSQDLVSWDVIARAEERSSSDTDTSRLERRKGYYRGR